MNQPHHARSEAISLDDARLLPRYRLAEQAAIFSTEFARARAQGITPSAPSRTIAVPSPGELRGIPVIGHGGAIPGTDPARQAEQLDAA